MIPVTRIGDTGTGVIFIPFPIPITFQHITGDPFTFADFSPVTRIGDQCSPANGVNTSGSTITFAGGLPVHRVGDSVKFMFPPGYGTSTSGAITTFAL